MILLFAAQEMFGQAFLGGSGHDLSRFYLTAAKRSVVCSERIVRAYGPMRFQVQNDQTLSPLGGSFLIIHNSPTQKVEFLPNEPLPSRVYPEVDSLTSETLPLTSVGLMSVGSDVTVSEKMWSPSTLNLTRIGVKDKGIAGGGSDSIDDLVNKGLSKPLNFPTFLGKFWFSCSLMTCNEHDFVNAIAQIAGCKLVEKPDSYNFIPDAEAIRKRLLRTYQLYGDSSNSLSGLHQRAVYRAYEIASSETIAESVSNPKMEKTYSVFDPVLKRDIQDLVAAAIVHFGSSKNEQTRKIANSVDTNSEVKVSYGYGFTFSPVVPLKDGGFWRF